MGCIKSLRICVKNKIVQSKDGGLEEEQKIIERRGSVVESSADPEEKVKDSSQLIKILEEHTEEK